MDFANEIMRGLFTLSVDCTLEFQVNIFHVVIIEHVQFPNIPVFLVFLLAIGLCKKTHGKVSLYIISSSFTAMSNQPIKLIQLGLHDQLEQKC